MTYRLSAGEQQETTLTLPFSKSITARALVLQALAEGQGAVVNISSSDDSQHLKQALDTMPAVIDVGAAGTAMRFLTAYLSVQEGVHTLTGSPRMLRRPIAELVSTLRTLGASISYVGVEGFPPLRIEGRPLQGGTVTIAGDVSSQFITALLLIAPTLEQGLTLHLVPPVVSRPYIALTIAMMRTYGAAVEWHDDETITVPAGKYTAQRYVVEGDWSAAAFWYETVALAKAPATELLLHPLSLPSIQGDAVVAEIFKGLGVQTTLATDPATGDEGVLLRKVSPTCERLELSCAAFPDLVPALVGTCCGMGIPFLFTGVETLPRKECDRLTVLQQELSKVGYTLTTDGTSYLASSAITSSPAHEIIIDPHDDHRIAMAIAPLALLHNGICIAHTDVVSKSYPSFWHALARAGITPSPLP